MRTRRQRARRRLCLALAFAAGVTTALGLTLALPASRGPLLALVTVTPAGAPAAGVWFHRYYTNDPRYRGDYLYYQWDRWHLRDHTYRTRDLMGREL